MVSGPLAFKTARERAAAEGVVGLEVLTLPLLAARLAGGFARPATSDDLEPAVAGALREGGFAEIGGLSELPGMTGAVVQTLTAAWRAEFRLAARADQSARIADLARLEMQIRSTLPTGALIPPDLRDAALARLDLAPILFGEITLDNLLHVEPVWHRVLAGVSQRLPIIWRASQGVATAEFPGRVEMLPAEPARCLSADVCADPRAEVVEALRWVRQLLSDGLATAPSVAIASAGTEPWDEHILVLARDAGLPIHFTHGRPALDTYEGQTCAALADVLLRGLSQERIRRLMFRTSVSAGELPAEWTRGLRRAARLYTVSEWRHALAAARLERITGAAVEDSLLPLLEILARGPTAAAEAGDRLLDGASLRLWRAALRAAPAEALERSLQGLRVPDPHPPGACVTWGPAAHLAEAPRPYVRLIGLTSRAWPRADSEDPLLPDHILPRREVRPVSHTEQDALAFQVISARASGALTLSRAQRSAEGAVLAPSRFWPESEAPLSRTRVPEHAFNEADRLLARPNDAAAEPRLALGRLCWRNWGKSGVTAHDGVLAPQHPLIAGALEQPQSPTSLRRLLRDPLGFAWRYGFGWRPAPRRTPPLRLDPVTFGELVHDLLRRAVDSLEPVPGLARATRMELEQAVERAAAEVAEEWPVKRAVPPPHLWRHAVRRGAAMALAGLAFDESFEPGTRSWTELPFGDPSAASQEPWDRTRPVTLGGLKISGRIDRMDIREAGDAVRVTDYKTGERPKNPEGLVLGGGVELQRVVYAAAARQLLPELERVVSRLVYLKGEPAEYRLAGDRLDAAVQEVARYIEVASDLIRQGATCPGREEALGRHYEAAIALPADLESYFRRKGAAFDSALAPLRPLWGRG